jgi:hypothetical protein
MLNFDTAFLKLYKSYIQIKSWQEILLVKNLK